MADRFADPAYWEAWARDLGWEQGRIQAAGEVGSSAIKRGMTYKEATDVVLARVRDGRAARIGPSLTMTMLRNEGFMPMLFGVVAFLAIGVEKFGHRSDTYSQSLSVSYSEPRCSCSSEVLHDEDGSGV